MPLYVDTVEQAMAITALTDGTGRNIMTNRDMPFLTEFWETEALIPALWESTIDGAGTEAFATAGGRMYYDIDTDAVVDNDVFINSKYRWQVQPGLFSDANVVIEKFILEFEVELEAAITSHDNTHFFLGLSSAKSNDITQANLIGFHLVADALKGKTDKAGAETATGTITATLTDWNKFRIEISDTSVIFSVNGVAEPAIITNLPDVAMYIVLGTRDENGAGSVGLNIGNVRAWYEEAGQ